MSTSIWAFLGSLIVHGQSLLVYPLGYVERPREVHEPTAMGLPFEDLRLTTSDNVTVACHLMLFSEFYARLSPPLSSVEPKTRTSPVTTTPQLDADAVSGRATVIMFHGNAMNHGDLVELAAQFLNMGCNVLTVSYRGYGHSTGTPSESGLRIDAQTALDYLLHHPTLSTVPIIIFGQSLGGAVAIDLASRNPTHTTALILENTFLSIPLLVRDWPSPFGPLSFLCTQRWPSMERIGKVSKKVPILMLSGDEDVVVPPKHMKGLWVAAKARCAPGEEDEMEGGEQEGRPKADDEKSPSCSPFFFVCPPVRRKRKRKKMGVEDVEKAVVEEMALVESPASIWNGKDLFRYFSGRGHENTSLDETYWVAVRTFLDKLDLPPMGGSRPLS